MQSDAPRMYVPLLALVQFAELDLLLTATAIRRPFLDNLGRINKVRLGKADLPPGRIAIGNPGENS